MPLMHIADAFFGPMADWGRAMFSAFAQAAAPAAVAALWQGAAVAAGVVSLPAVCASRLRGAPVCVVGDRICGGGWIAASAVASCIPAV